MTPISSPTAIQPGQVLRAASPKSTQPATQDGYPNIYAVTALEGGKFVPLASGINRMASVKSIDGPRVPAILLASSPHKIGTTETPWQDHFEADNGYIRFYGDNRRPGTDPAGRPGNSALLRAFERHSHHDPAVRRDAVPLIYFRRVPREGKQKGYLRFEGFGIIASVELVSQYSAKAGGSFANYAFDLLVMSMKEEAEEFDWSWINVRRSPQSDLDRCVGSAPKAWRDWIKHGSADLDRVRRRVSKLMVEPPNEQLPPPGSPEASILDEVYAFYTDRGNAKFEALAAVVAERVIAPSGSSYIPGGLTKASGDGGIDFFGRLDVGTGFDGAHLGPAKLVVLGQAKCEQPSTPTSGRHIARTVARLRRGWLGVYVTTSSFSRNTQREVIEDRYPIVLINGQRVAEEVHKMLVEKGGDIEVKDFLEEFDAEHGQKIEIIDPEELLKR